MDSMEVSADLTATVTEYRLEHPDVTDMDAAYRDAVPIGNGTDTSAVSLHDWRMTWIHLDRMNRSDAIDEEPDCCA